MRTITFTVPGPPRGKGRPKFARRGQFVSTYTDAKTEAYESLVRIAYAQEAKGAEPLTGEAHIEVTAYMPVASSLSNKRKAALCGCGHTKKPDIDNVLKAVMDGLNGVAFRDDAQISHISASKYYDAVPRLVVEITEIREA